ncbi:GMC family oxidoreductase [Gordonia hankookensis]|uniref:GMC family oxidoreductase N-terminal domain-containing protein n=1 Tax=Gordonia hankookensis TaxID=589403 RepID=A0ABR7WFA7_9ACTN|nr:GMC family oxidoreductase N-terminal domain-containing protein [Gordonia hankookensis]MBD1321471.1 GMC family oxidoreductase N-terminal domain-containing protein [Gordonia hankookensis]
MPTTAPRTVDYVVVGTGSAGAVVANRLSADSRNEVLVLEAGTKDSDKFIHIPAAFSKLFGSASDWDYSTEPQPELGGRRVVYPRGKTLGGSSSMNAMMWVRGFAADYDAWSEHAGADWSFDGLVEYFRRIENVAGATENDEGTTGPLHVSHQRSPRPLTRAFLDAAAECGHTVERANLPEPKGFSQTMVTQHKGARFSTADAYLRPALKRKNLSLVTEALATKVLFDGTRAVGVEYTHAGRTQTVHARREVVLCGGAVNTPQLLMLSGVGDSDDLAGHGIRTVAHNGGVGRNLLDHLLAPIGWDVDSGTLRDAESPRQLADYLLRRRGMLTSNVGEAYGFIRSRDDLRLPDLELIFAPVAFYNEGVGEAYPHHAVAMGPILVQPKSTGTITLRSADPTAKPMIDPRYLSDPAGVDRAAMMQGLRATVEIAQAPSLRGRLGVVSQPRTDSRVPDDAVLTEVLDRHSHTLYHPVGTCRMGTDTDSVVTPTLAVRGVTGLRVADASVMPTIVRGHTHAPSVLIGEKAADLILAGR